MLRDVCWTIVVLLTSSAAKIRQWWPVFWNYWYKMTCEIRRSPVIDFYLLDVTLVCDVHNWAVGCSFTDMIVCPVFIWYSMPCLHMVLQITYRRKSSFSLFTYKRLLSVRTAWYLCDCWKYLYYLCSWDRSRSTFHLMDRSGNSSRNCWFKTSWAN